MSSEHVVVTTDNRGPLVNIAAWITLVTMCLAAGAKICSKIWLISKVQKDDLYMFAAVLAATGQTVAVAKQVNAGLGQHQENLKLSEIQDYERAGYTSQLLFIMSLFFAKLSVLQFITTLALSNIRRIITKGVVASVIIWAVVAIFALAFQCHFPRPWAILSDQCHNQLAFWYVIGILDILTDLAIVVLPIYLLRDVRLPSKQKLLVMSVFAGRILVIPITITRLFFIVAASRSLQHTYDDFETAITTQIDMNISIILACIPFLKPFVDNLLVGLLTSDLHTLASLQGPKRSKDRYALGFIPESAQPWSRIKRSTTTDVTAGQAVQDNVKLRGDSSGKDSIDRLVVH